MNQTKKSNIFQYIKELSIVVLGILIALFINNWNEEVKQQKFLDKTLFAINKEIAFSKEEINNTLKKHGKLISLLYKEIDNEDLSIKDMITESGGLQIPEIQNISLKYFVAGNPELIDYEMISGLSKIEFVTKGLNFKTDKLIAFLYKNMDSHSLSEKSILAEYLSEVMDSEGDLLDTYEDFLEKYNNQL
ncbi:MAG: hypothetical protein AB8F74_03995 [Saprospiraceae bacterium]